MLEEEYIENLQQQIHFMELELKLLQQKQEEADKTGGVGGLFIDEKSTTEHLGQMRDKYQIMKRELDRRATELNRQKIDVVGQAHMLKAQKDMLNEQMRKTNMDKEEHDKRIHSGLAKLQADATQQRSLKITLESKLQLLKDQHKEEIKRNQDLRARQAASEAEQKATIENLKREIAYHEKLMEQLKKEIEARNALSQTEKQNLEQNGEILKNKQRMVELMKQIGEKEKIVIRLRVRVQELEELKELHNRSKEELAAEKRALAVKFEELKRTLEEKHISNQSTLQRRVKDKISVKTAELKESYDKLIMEKEKLKSELDESKAKLKNLDRDRYRVMSENEIAKKKLAELQDITTKQNTELLNLRAKALAAHEEIVKADEGMAAVRQRNAEVKEHEKMLEEQLAARTTKLNFTKGNVIIFL